ncbi:MAG: hypothetical protein ACR2N3_09745 [Pyrinomonadaceae bacterium]
MLKIFLKFNRLTFHLIGFSLIFFVSAQKFKAQEVVDKTVATVSDSVKTELITYSDLLWQLALQPDAPIRPPNSPDLNRALQTLVNQRLIALEAERLPSLAPTDAEVKAEIKRVLDRFPSNAEFERRLRVVGFDSVTDDNFERIMRQRVTIDKYLDFRFRSFVIITPQDEEKYYRETFVPDFRKKNPGVLVPSLEDSRAQINKILTETKISDDIEKYLEDARRRAEIEILFEV